MAEGSHLLSRIRARAPIFGALLAFGFILGGCNSFEQSFQRGYVLPEGGLEQIPVGSTQEQVLIVLGTPSTVATVSGEVFYYISQRGERAAAFLRQEVTDQRVIAVYFDKSRRVERLADYRAEGRQDLRLCQPDDPDQRTGPQLHHLPAQDFRREVIGPPIAQTPA